MIEHMSFRKVPRNPKNSLIGFCSFKFNREFAFTDAAVHKLLKPNGRIHIRLRYPNEIRPINKEMQQLIDEEVNAYILANYKEDIH